MMIKYVIDYRSPPGGLGHIILEDGTEIHVPYASGYEDGATDDPGWDEERRMLREHGVTHVVDAEFYSDLEYEEMQKHDLFELIPIADWLPETRSAPVVTESREISRESVYGVPVTEVNRRPMHDFGPVAVSVRWDDPECGQPTTWRMLMRDGPKVGMRVHTYDGDQFVYPTPASDAGVGSATTTTETTTEGGDR